MQQGQVQLSLVLKLVCENVCVCTSACDVQVSEYMCTCGHDQASVHVSVHVHVCSAHLCVSCEQSGIRPVLAVGD